MHSTEDEHDRRIVAAPHLALDDVDDRPARRRRSALLGGGALVAAAPIAVGAGLFVAGYAALAVGALLLLLPPRARRKRRHPSLRTVAGARAAAIGERVLALARAIGAGGVRMWNALELLAATKGRDGAGRVGRAARAAGSRAWSALQIAVPRSWRRLVLAARCIVRKTRVTSARLWVRVRPLLRRSWLACRAGSVRAARRVAAVERSASERLSAYVDSHSATRRR